MDTKKAACGALNPLYSAAVGEIELDEILHGPAKLNSLIKGGQQEATEPWGLEVRRY